MKKISFLLLACILGMMTISAQKSADRILIQETSGNIKGFLPERVDSIFFAKVEGEVAAKIELREVIEGDDPIIKLSTTMTDACQGYRIGIIQPSQAIYLQKDEWVVEFVETYFPQIFFQSYPTAELTGFEEPFAADADYTLVSVGYDQYGIACTVDKVTFHTSKPAIVGNPQVDYEIVDVQATEVTIKFIPNSDVMCYYYCIFDKGTLMEQFEQWGSMFGFNTPAEMIANWCGETLTRTTTHTWKELNPGKEYEVYVAMKDRAGNFADLMAVPVKTESYGGEGLSEISIEIGEFNYQSDYDVYTQRVIFTPNDDTNFFHDMLIEKAAIGTADWPDENSVIEYLKSDPYGGMYPYWDLYGVDDYEWEVKPDTEYYAYALGQNALGEWGTLAKKEFKTGAAVNGAARMAKAPARFIKNSVTKGLGHNINLNAKPKAKKIEFSGK